MSKVYLCGPMSGLTVDQIKHEWRQEVFEQLRNNNIECFSPVRHRENLIDGCVSHMGAEDDAFMSAKGITTRDRFDVQRCDLLFCSVLGSKEISRGTLIEFGWADAWRKPIVLCMEPGNVHEHLMVLDVANYVVPTLDKGIEIALSLLVPGV